MQGAVKEERSEISTENHKENTCNITQGPNGLFAYVRMGRCHQADEGWDGPSFHNSSGLV